MINWSISQKQKLIELNGKSELLDLRFQDKQKRDQTFQKIEKELVKKNKDHLLELKEVIHRPLLSSLEIQLSNLLCKTGFVQVNTPIILPKAMLHKMTITPEHPLYKQVFWVDNNKCLRPMLAPNLYHYLKILDRLWSKPVRIFEIGPCFRKESQGAQHLNEFTMLNLVELGVDKGKQTERLKELGSLVMEEIGVKNYEFVETESEIYGITVDVVFDDLELGSGAFGPLKMDEQWGIFEPWVGIGFGLERLAMTLQGHRNIRRVGRGLTYLDGSLLNI
ncbi:pyrrolysine--tRNA(Pyl) ligase large subunit [Desulfoscipio gibsoniae]|uniref:Pyrrolysyl-tRNA synthetase, C-terminal region n=1 Tax=Desulfoscipio gibsoniae DSM 7213 TaxID=767817 RepID=R4KKM0_9FIRM|nr:pyrrolysine--tRNA(Pyl) ligase large subunit [Desulfoscipio gibsoniae]AGL03209.1 pyrrolysyl-tRNA synthetase, C-terminal region [Desulfoscipio gibsoniae DSM 7213]